MRHVLTAFLAVFVLGGCAPKNQPAADTDRAAKAASALPWAAETVWTVRERWELTQEVHLYLEDERGDRLALYVSYGSTLNSPYNPLPLLRVGDRVHLQINEEMRWAVVAYWTRLGSTTNKSLSIEPDLIRNTEPPKRVPVESAR